jgi:hypothetical protein
MFPSLKTEVTTRILQIETFFNAVHPPAPPVAGVSPTAPPGSQTARGLVFVALYGVWEYAVSSAVDAAVEEIRRQGLPLSSLRLDLLGFLLHWDYDAVSKCGRETMWERRISLLQKTVSVDPFAAASLPFPNDGSHYRAAQLQTIWGIFGITTVGIVPDIRLQGRIGEMVDHRNDIAHGNVTAASVGCRYSEAQIRQIIAAVQELCLHVVTTLETHCSTAANLAR